MLSVYGTGVATQGSTPTMSQLIQGLERQSDDSQTRASSMDQQVAGQFLEEEIFDEYDVLPDFGETRACLTDAVSGLILTQRLCYQCFVTCVRS